MSNNKKRDDELLILVILGILFTGGLVALDIWYSSIGKMHMILQATVWLGHIALAAIWVLVVGKWKDPNYDKYRKLAFYLATVLMLIVGIHHATVKEDQQAIIDSQENAAKP